MTRLRIFFIGLGCALLLGIAAAWWFLDGLATTRPTQGKPWNLILISLDTCRADRLSCYGAERDNSPNIARFAESASVWNDCLAQSTSTGPSHRSLFTSHYVHRHGMFENDYWQSPYNMASLLHAAGWKTAAFTGGGYMRLQFGFGKGFERFLGVTLPIPPEGSPNWRYLDEVLPQAQDWIAKRDSEERFFAFVHAYDPHCPYWPEDDWRQRYAAWYQGDFRPGGLCGPKDFGPLMESEQIGEDEKRYLSDLYDASIAHADQQLGAFFDFLENEDLLDESIIVFTSDHGESLGEHDWIGHVRMWEEQARVPLLIRFPNGEWAGRYDQPVELIDVLPTLLSALELEAPAGMQGVDLLPVLQGAEAYPAQRMRLCKFGGREAVRFDDRWKLVFRRSRGKIVERQLYDLQEDPGELNDLIPTAAGAARAEEILNRYLAWRERTASEDAAYRGSRERAELEEWNQKELDELGYSQSSSDD